MLVYIFNFVTTVLVASIGWLVRKIFQLEEDIQVLRRETMSRKEVNEEIDVRQEALRVLQQEQKEDIKRIEDKLDRVLELISRK